MLIEKISPHGYRVKSEEGTDWYMVFVDRSKNKFTCTCNDFTFRGGTQKGYKCKHIRAVMDES